MRVVRRNQMFPFFSNAFENELMKEFYGKEKPAFTPSFNVREEKESFELELVVPGMKKDDFSIELDKHQLKVSATLKKEETENKKKYTRREFVAQSFSKSFTLPEGKINEEGIQANYDSGILYVSLPKQEKVEEKVKQISIK